ncbi:hypothetical protein ACVMIH_000965 [Bradyrhizobium sp. USDA 4503]
MNWQWKSPEIKNGAGGSKDTEAPRGPSARLRLTVVSTHRR